MYEDVTGLCKAATLAEIEEQDFSLNPGRYVGVVIEEDGLTEEEFISEMKDRQISLASLSERAHELENTYARNPRIILDARRMTYGSGWGCNPVFLLQLLQSCERVLNFKERINHPFCFDFMLFCKKYDCIIFT